MESPLHEAAAGEGAVMGAVGGCAVPRHFGDPAAEYAALRDAAAVIDRSDLARLRLHGRDPVRMVQGLITNDLAGSPAGRAVYAAMLTAKGRVVAELRALRRPGETGEEVWIDLPREALEGTVEHFRHFVPPLFARVEDLGGRAGTVGIYGPEAGGVMASVFATSAPDLPEDAVLELSFHDRPVLAVRTLYTGPPGGWDLWADADLLPALWEALLAAEGARPAGFGALETARIEAGRPRYGVDISLDTIPQEAYERTGLMERAISFGKGCYTGQEVVVRIAHRGRVNRNLRGLRLGDAAVPAPRTPVTNPETGKEVGWTTSAAVSPALGETIALAYLRREVEDDDRLQVGDAGAVATPLPFDGAASG
jgi:folate-binding protein YgfZ